VARVPLAEVARDTLLAKEGPAERALLRKLAGAADDVRRVVVVGGDGKANSRTEPEGLTRADWGSGCCMFWRRLMLLSSTLRPVCRARAAATEAMPVTSNRLISSVSERA